MMPLFRKSYISKITHDRNRDDRHQNDDQYWN